METKDSVAEKILIVNGREVKWQGETMAYDQIVVLSFGRFIPSSNTIYSVTFTRGIEKRNEGSMVLGDVIEVKDKMIFNVTATSQS